MTRLIRSHSALEAAWCTRPHVGNATVLLLLVYAFSHVCYKWPLRGCHFYSNHHIYQSTGWYSSTQTVNNYVGVSSVRTGGNYYAKMLFPVHVWTLMCVALERTENSYLCALIPFLLIYFPALWMKICHRQISFVHVNTGAVT